MARFGFDDDDFSLSGLMQEGHNFDVTVISSSSDDDNYGGLLDCAWKLAGEISEKTSSLEGGMQPGVEPGIEPNASNMPISKTVYTVSITSNSMASSVSQSDELIHVSFIHFHNLLYLKFECKVLFIFLVLVGFHTIIFFIMLLSHDWNPALWLVDFDLSPSRHFLFMADGSVVVNVINFKCNFRAFPIWVQYSFWENK